MNNTKKMILVEPRQLEKLKESMLDKTLLKLDGEIYEILHRNTDDDEKAKLYSNSLSRYLNLDKPSIVTKFSSNDAVQEVAAKDSKSIESMLLDTVPKKWKSHASRLLTHIKSIPDIRWSDKGEMILKNSVIAKTHIVDLVNDLLRKRTSTSTPTGWKQLADALKEYNIPRELIGNVDRWNYINDTHNESTSVAQKSTASGKRRRQRKRIDWEPYLWIHISIRNIRVVSVV